MHIETKFNVGDKGWTFDGAHVRQRTIGQITAKYTKSEGIGDGYMEGGIASYSGGNNGQVADNYAPIAEQYVEEYMCVETGIGSGSIYTFGKHIFLTEEECRIACAAAIQEQAEADAKRKQWERERILREEPLLRAQFARIEQLKADAA
jgi:hypothetical protein